MTLGHRLTVVYAIMATSLVLGNIHGIRHVHALVENGEPEPRLLKVQRYVTGRCTTVYLVGAILVSVMFLSMTTQPRRKNRNGKVEPKAGGRGPTPPQP